MRNIEGPKKIEVFSCEWCRFLLCEIDSLHCIHDAAFRKNSRFGLISERRTVSENLSTLTPEWCPFLKKEKTNE